MTETEYYEFCQRYEKFRIERAADGSITFRAPTGFEAGNRNEELLFQLGAWTRRDGRGKAFDSNTEYLLPDGSALSPDASWVRKDRIDGLSKEQKRQFPKLCPDFIVELMSPSDRLVRLKKKMQQWIDNGVSLGWLIDPESQTVMIYRPGQEPETLIHPESVVGEGPVMGFVLELKEIWAGL